MICQVIKTFCRKGEMQMPGSIVVIPDIHLTRLAGYIRQVDNCHFWRQVCHAVGMYQAACSGTADSQCPIFRFLERNTDDKHKGYLTDLKNSRR